MTKPVTIPNTFATATTAIPLSNLDADFSTVATAMNDANTYSNYAADTGSANAYVVTLTGISAIYSAGLRIQFKAGNANTTASTLNVNAQGAKNITYQDASAIASGTIAANSIVDVMYDGTQFLLMNDPAGGTGGDVVGPASATDNAIVRFDGTTGKLVQNSVVTIADSTGDISGVGQLNATTLDATNIEVTNIKAKDGTAAASIADSTGVVSVTANPVLSGGTANGVLYLDGSKVATSGSGLVFDSSGNLGLGVTPSSITDGTMNRFQFGGYASLASSVGTFGALNLALNAVTNNATAYYLNSTDPATMYNQYNGQHRFYTAPSGTAGNAITFTQAMTLDASGRLGVAETSPTAQLVVKGSGGSGWLAGARNALQLYNPNTTSSNVSNIIVLGDASNSTRWQILNDPVATGAEANVLAIYNGGTERARITSGGDLLVGTTSQIGTEKFGVDSGSSPCGKFKGGNASNVTIDAWNPATSGDNIFVAFRTETAETTRGTISYNRVGGLVAYNTTSDYRAKDILGSVTDSGATIDALKVYEGKMKGATQSRPMLVAHEAQEVAPYAVTGEKDAVDDDGNPKYQQMDVSSFVPLLIAEIQSLRLRVAQLEGTQP